MQAACGFVNALLVRSAARSLGRGSISSASQFPREATAATATALCHSSITSSSLSQFQHQRWISQLVLGVTPIRLGVWSAPVKQRSAAVLRRFSSTVTASNAGQEVKKWRFSAIILFLPCAATFGLGTWQLFRRQWKIEVLDYRRQRLEEEPIPLVDYMRSLVEVSNPDDKNAPSSRTPVDELEFRRVICEGVYDVQKNLYVGPRGRSAFGVTEKGYFIITSLRIADSKSGQVSVLVNRGWVPSGWVEEPDLGHSVETSDKATTSQKVQWWKFWTTEQIPLDSKVDNVSRPQQTVTVHGVIRGSEEPNMFVPLNVPSTGQWFYIDVPAMARTLGLPENTILIEVLQEPNKSAGKERFPIPKDPEALLHSSVMPADHINYALTWYSLSAATTFMAVKRVWGSRKGR